MSSGHAFAPDSSGTEGSPQALDCPLQTLARWVLGYLRDAHHPLRAELHSYQEDAWVWEL